MDIVITDLDGTLLDHATYSFDPARPALELLDRRGIPLVFCSSKARAEVEHWRRLTGNTHPFVVENGGAVFIPAGYFDVPQTETREGYAVLSVGAPYGDLVNALKQASARSGCAVRGFADMEVAEIAGLCNLDPEIAAKAKQREYDEPFIILETEKTDGLLAAIESMGKRWTRGGRFYHITGNNDKAGAVARLLDLYRMAHGEIRTVGLGDGLNDAEFLKLMDIPILIRTRWLERLEAAVPRGRATRSPGPQGWNEMVLELFAATG
jgi:mannosyl-3-phosphoglycerate phosphatase